MSAPVEGIPPFWTEPWRWAAPAWHGRYGASVGDFDSHAERLVYSGWIACFGLPRRWRPPADPRWVHVVQASPSLLHGVATALGHLALLRGGMPVALGCRPSVDPWFALALKYRAVNCLRVGGVVTHSDSSAPRDAGVGVLRAMARQGWPDIDSRVAMLVAPDASDACHTWEEPKQAQPWAIEWIDVGRCLSLCGAMMRGAASNTSSRGTR
ncbi:hypothetical protein [Trinickia dinghuensis]|nr:hypothetical protein [Trinickia dinghuensis]